MHISWLGQTCVKLQTKNIDEDVVILIDAYKPDKGNFPRNFSPQIALFSKGQNGATTVGGAFVLDTLGEVEIKKVLITAMPGSDDNIIFKINAEGMNLVHLGRQSKKIDPAIMEKIGTPDILFIPVGGGKDYLNPENAVEIINELEPRTVAPVAFKCDTDPSALPIGNFLKESGLKDGKPEPKIIIKKKDLPQEERALFLLEKNY